MWTFILGIITKILDLFKSKEDRKNAKEKLINTEPFRKAEEKKQIKESPKEEIKRLVYTKRTN